MNAAELTALAARLSGDAVETPQLVRGGGNNRIYRVRGRRGDYALKHYLQAPEDARERYEREYGGLRFLWEAGLRTIPRPLALDASAQFALFAWIEGVAPAEPAAADVDALAAFARELRRVSALPGAAALAAAREAVDSRSELERQVAFRIARLAPLTGGDAALAAVHAAIAGEFNRRRDVSPNASRSVAVRTLSPSDFGFHNALRTAGGLTFLDFEYFGWDDPVKLVADVVWHPGMALDGGAARRFFTGVADVYGVDTDFEARFERDAPLYGLRWALIVLNEFLPEVWQRRVAAGRSDDRDAVLAAQLEKARGLLGRVRSGAVFA